MTATPAVPAASTPSPMASDPDALHSTASTSSDALEDQQAPAAGAAQPAVAVAAKPRIRLSLGDNPLLTVLGTAAVGLLVLVLTDHSRRISNLDNEVDRGFASITERMDERFEKVDERFEKVDQRFAVMDEKIDQRFTVMDEKINQISLKLTALIAALNMELEVQAAVEGDLKPDRAS